MQTLRVLLVDNKETVKKLLEEKLLNADAMKFVVTLFNPKSAKHAIEGVGHDFDVIAFGEKLSPKVVADMAKLFRSVGVKAPMLMLTNQSEARLPQLLDQAGIDDMLNIAEMNTPLFVWTFQSLLEHVEVRKKLKDYDVLRFRLKHIDESLGELMHKINNPLSVIRLTLYHLENPNLAPDKREVFFKLLVEHVKKIDGHMDELRSIRRQLGKDTSLLTKILSLKAVKQVVAAQ
jgi:hypothetical protein